MPEAPVQFVLIDDTAGQDPAIRPIAKESGIQVIAPPYNLGHQGALVFALRGLGSLIQETDVVVTMDADGEDRPKDLTALVTALLKEQDNLHRVSIAIRTQRTESIAFKVFYLAFKIVFRTLTGTVIRNGNFAAYRGWLLREVIFHPHFDQCYSSSFMSLPMQIEKVPLPRGTRYEGKSKMGFMGLFTHGIRMLMPFSERIATRGMIVSVGAMTLSLGVFLTEIFLGRFDVLPLFTLTLAALGLGVCVILFATFSQNKARSLRGLSPLKR